MSGDTVVELRKSAKKLEIPYYSSMRKSELKSAINSAKKASAKKKSARKISAKKESARKISAKKESARKISAKK